MPERTPVLVRGLSLSALVFTATVAVAAVQPIPAVAPSLVGMLDGVLDAMKVLPPGILPPACMRGISEPYAALRPRFEAETRRQADLRAALNQALSAVSTVAGRAAARGAIAEFSQAVEAQHRLKAQFQSEVRIALERERDKEPIAVGMCLGGFELSFKEAEPYTERLRAESAKMARAADAMIDLLGQFDASVAQYGSPELVPRTDMRYLALRDAVMEWALVQDEMQRAMDAYLAYKELGLQALKEMSRPAPRR